MEDIIKKYLERGVPIRDILKDYLYDQGFRNVNLDRFLRHYKSHGITEDLLKTLALEWALNKLVEGNIAREVDSSFVEDLLETVKKKKRSVEDGDAIDGLLKAVGDIKRSKKEASDRECLRKDFEQQVEQLCDDGGVLDRISGNFSDLASGIEKMCFRYAVDAILDDTIARLEAAAEACAFDNDGHASVDLESPLHSPLHSEDIQHGSWIDTPRGLYQVLRISGSVPNRIFWTCGSAFNERDVRLWEPKKGEVAVFYHRDYAVIAKLSSIVVSSKLEGKRYLAAGCLFSSCVPFTTMEDFINLK